ncbi:unnamed protein product [Lactuca virosa]|uniref:Hexosyltransferase n=1 Tax=Lactuca virosa TaxID=75947 RepID=A0AAU9N021_9ASTR|nr:unnamed protein product [Lactuca virosa]
MKTTSTRSFPIFNISLSDLEPLRSNSSSFLMAYSVGSSSANDIVVATRNRDNNLCNCRHLPKFTVERISMFDKNPARRFRSCVDSLVSIFFFGVCCLQNGVMGYEILCDNVEVEMATKKCKYFKSIDGDLTPHYKHAFNNLKYEMQLMKDNSYTGRLERRVIMLENLNAEITTAKDILDGEFSIAIEDKKQLSG